MERLQSLINGACCVRAREYAHLMGVILPAVTSGRLDVVDRMLQGADLPTSVINATAANTCSSSWHLDDLALPDNTVAVIRLEGFLYSWVTLHVIDALEAAFSNPKIIGIILRIDGPGGMASHVDRLASMIATAPKPVATVCEGSMCSAHFWIGTAASRVFVDSKLAEVGSVGTMMSFFGLKKFYETNGIDYRDIYPDTSDLKNVAYRQLWEKGDETLIKEKLERIQRIFCESVAANTGIEYDESSPLYRGATFYADEALRMGIVDQKGGLDDAVTWILAESIKSQIEEEFNQP